MPKSAQCMSPTASLFSSKYKASVLAPIVTVTSAMNTTGISPCSPTPVGTSQAILYPLKALS